MPEEISPNLPLQLLLMTLVTASKWYGLLAGVRIGQLHQPSFSMPISIG